MIKLIALIIDIHEWLTHDDNDIKVHDNDSLFITHNDYRLSMTL